MLISEKPQGLIVNHNFLPPESDIHSLALVDSGIWREDLGRLTQQYGARYNYKTRKLDYDVPPIEGSVVEPIVKMLEPTFALYSREIGSKEKIEQVIVNDYQPTQRISKHIDSPLFGPLVMTYTLGSGTNIVFRRKGYKTFKVQTSQGTIITLTGDSRTEWTHETEPIHKNERRVSVTFRTFA